MSSKKKKPKTNFSYSDKSEEIDKELAKRRPRWFLNSITWFDFEDVCQIIRAHIHSKWHQWDQSRPLEPWVNRIISNQMKNILRNHYSNFVRPCLNCPFNQITQDVFNIDNATLRLHEAMKQTLPPKQYEVYHMLFVEHQEEEDVAKALGYKSNEKGRKAGYKQIKNLRKKFKNHAIILIKKLDICL